MREVLALEDLFRNKLEEAIGQPLHFWSQYRPALQIVELRKNQFLFEENSSSNSAFLIIEGLLHLAYESPIGSRTKSFVWEKKWLLPETTDSENPDSLAEPPPFSAQALEPSSLLSIKYDLLLTWSEQEIVLKDFFKQILERKLRETERRQFHLLMLSPLDRYNQFLMDYGEIANRLPQYLIASYIGLTPVSLSRLLNSAKLGR